MLHVANFVPH